MFGSQIGKGLEAAFFEIKKSILGFAEDFPHEFCRWPEPFVVYWKEWRQDEMDEEVFMVESSAARASFYFHHF